MVDEEAINVGKGNNITFMLHDAIQCYKLLKLWAKTMGTTIFSLKALMDCIFLYPAVIVFPVYSTGIMVDVPLIQWRLNKWLMV